MNMTNKITDITDRLLQKKIENETTRILNFTPSIEEVEAFLKVIDWLRLKSSSDTGLLEYDSESLSVVIEEQTDDKENEDGVYVSGTTLSVSGRMHNHINIISDEDNDVAYDRAVTFLKMVEDVSKEIFGENDDDKEEGE